MGDVSRLPPNDLVVRDFGLAVRPAGPGQAVDPARLQRNLRPHQKPVDRIDRHHRVPHQRPMRALSPARIASGRGRSESEPVSKKPTYAVFGTVPSTGVTRCSSDGDMRKMTASPGPVLATR